jgi:hypothetical protein
LGGILGITYLKGGILDILNNKGGNLDICRLFIYRDTGFRPDSYTWFLYVGSIHRGTAWA